LPSFTVVDFNWTEMKRHRDSFTALITITADLHLVKFILPKEVKILPETV